LKRHQSNFCSFGAAYLSDKNRHSNKIQDIILIVGIVLISLWTSIPLFVSYPFNWIIISAYWAWQLADAIRLYRKMKSGVGLEITK